MTTTQIKELINPTISDKETILSPLNNLDEQHKLKWEKSTFTFVLTQEGKIKGGLVANLHWDWLYIELLSIHIDFQGQGYGSSLVKTAEQRAKENDCHGAWVNTFSFQAPKFYENLGYKEFGRILEYPKGHARLFYQKQF